MNMLLSITNASAASSAMLSAIEQLWQHVSHIVRRLAVHGNILAEYTFSPIVLLFLTHSIIRLVLAADRHCAIYR